MKFPLLTFNLESCLLVIGGNLQDKNTTQALRILLPLIFQDLRKKEYQHCHRITLETETKNMLKSLLVFCSTFDGINVPLFTWTTSNPYLFSCILNPLPRLFLVDYLALCDEQGIQDGIKWNI